MFTPLSLMLLGLQLPQVEPFFTEGFDDSRLLDRGWYDGSRIALSRELPKAGAGCIEYHWKSGATTPDGTQTLRRLFEPSESVYVRFWIRLSKGWRWSGKPFHPHLIQLLTTENGRYHGPAASHLTLYIEPQEGRLRLAAQDIQNKDTRHGLTQGPLKGGYNGTFWDSDKALFTDAEWHKVEVVFQLNSLKDGKAVRDGVARGWFDGRLVVDRSDLVLRSPDFPKMRLNQILLAPYFGSGLLPQAQTIWIDEMLVGRPRSGNGVP